ncbi:perlucin-like protein [Anopheles stephensi]|uniref:C-type lectin domain-containing protein n=1 Tax=Anopheles stephensi TaxID=30069 RepID=A0A182YED4_ANOST|nr:perlucin-like protein [Anopheles stephensi]
MNLMFRATVVVLVSLAAFAHGLKTFVAYKRAINPLQAVQICSQQGGHLASIESLEEHNKVLAAIAATGYPVDLNYWFIGGSDLGTEGKWFWMGVDKEMKYKNFRSGEPNNYQDQHCMAIIGVGSSTEWDDIWCDHIGTGFVCAYEVS